MSRVYWRTCRLCWESYWDCPEGVALHMSEQGHVPERHRLRRRQPISSSVRRGVYERDGFTCRACGFSDPAWEPIVGRKRHEGNYLTLDHVTPWVLGGSNDPSNLQTLCFDCNQAKSRDDKRQLEAVLDFLRDAGLTVPGAFEGVPQRPAPIEGVAP
jgi:5-methylcytosine-specific restriction protein A